jgi:hypothetical protein
MLPWGTLTESPFYLAIDTVRRNREWDWTAGKSAATSAGFAVDTSRAITDDLSSARSLLSR